MAASLTEIVGSRKQKTGHKATEGTLLFVTTGIATAPTLDGGVALWQRFVPDGEVATTYTGDNVLMGRRAFHNDIDIDTLPGVVFIATHYKAFVARA